MPLWDSWYWEQIASSKIRLTRLIASEIEYLDVYEFAEELDSKTAKISNACISSPSCPQRIANKNDAEAIPAGKVSRRGKNLVFSLVPGKSRILRREKITLPNDNMTLADEIGIYISKVITEKRQLQRGNRR